MHYRCELEAIDKTADDLEDTARQHNSKTLYWNVNKLRGRSQSGLVPVKDGKEATISNKKRVKERRAKHFENMPNRDRAARKDRGN